MVAIRFDTHFFLAAAPDGRRPAARRRRDRRPRLVHAAGRARGARARRDPARVPDDQDARAARRASPPPTSCSSGRPAARSSPSSRRSSATGRRPASCCRANPGTRLTADRRRHRADGRHRPRAAARGSTPTRSWSGCSAWRGAPFDPGVARAARRPSTARATCSTATPSPTLARRRRRARAPRVHHRRRPRGDPLGQPRGLAQRVRRPRATCTRLVYTSSVAAYGFHADNPQPLTEDVPRARHATRTTTRRRRPSSSRRCARRSTAPTSRPTCSGRASSPGGDALALIEAFPARRCARSPVGPVLPEPGHAVPARAHRRRRARAGRRGPRRGRARRLQPRRRRDDHRRRPRARARLALRAGPARRASRSTAGVVDLLPLMPPQALVAERLPRAGRDGHRARPRASSAGSRATTRRPCSPTWPRTRATPACSKSAPRRITRRVVARLPVAAITTRARRRWRRARARRSRRASRSTTVVRPARAREAPWRRACGRPRAATPGRCTRRRTRA